MTTVGNPYESYYDANQHAHVDVSAESTPPKLPSAYKLWQNLAHADRKLTAFISGDRTPAAVEKARRALAELRDVRLDIQSIETAINDAVGVVDDRQQDALADVFSSADRDDLYGDAVTS